GILTALESARAERVVCIACDMPLVDSAALTMVRDHAPDAEVVVPVVGGREEPLFARYARTAAPAIRAQLATGDYKVSRFFAGGRPVRLDEAALGGDLHFLTNVNTPDDLTSLPRPRPPRR